MAKLPEPTANLDAPFNGQGRDLIPAGNYVGVILDEEARFGVSRPSYDDPNVLEKRDEVSFLLGVIGDDGTKSLIQTQAMRLSGHEKSALVGMIRSIIGSDPGTGYDTANLIGKPVSVVVAHKTSRAGNVYAKVAGVSGIPARFAGDAPKLDDFDHGVAVEKEADEKAPAVAASFNASGDNGAPF